MFSYAERFTGALFGYDTEEEDTKEESQEPSEPLPESHSSESLWDSVWGNVKQMVSSVTNFAKTAGKTCVNCFKGVKTASEEAREQQASNSEKASTSDRGSIWERLKYRAENIYSSAVEKVKQIPEKVTGSCNTLKDKADGLWNDITNGAKKAKEALESTWAAYKTCCHELKEAWNVANTGDDVPVRERFRRFFSGAKDAICKASVQVCRSVKQVCKDAVVYAFQSLTSIVICTFDAATGALNAFEQCVYGFVKTCFNVGYAIYFGIKNASLSSFFHAVLDIAGTVVATIVSVFKNLAKFVRDTLTSNIKEIYSSVSGLMRNAKCLIINLYKLGAESIFIHMTTIVMITKAIMRMSPTMLVSAITKHVVSLFGALRKVALICKSIVNMVIQGYQSYLKVNNLLNMLKYGWNKSKYFAEMARRGKHKIVDAAKLLKHPRECIKKIRKSSVVEMKKMAASGLDNLKTIRLSSMQAAKSICAQMKGHVRYIANVIQTLLSKLPQISLRRLSESTLEKCKKRFSFIKETVFSKASEFCEMCQNVCQNAYWHLKKIPMDFFLTLCKYCLLARCFIKMKIDKYTSFIREKVSSVLAPISRATSAVESTVDDINSIHDNIHRIPNVMDKYEQDKRKQIREKIKSMKESIDELHTGDIKTSEEKQEEELCVTEALQKADKALGKLISNIDSAQGYVDNTSSNTATELLLDAFQKTVVKHKESDWTEIPRQRKVISRSN